MQLNQQKRRLSLLLQSMPYYNKKTLEDHLIDFIQIQQGFRFRQGVISQQGEFYSFIEVVGYILINSHYIQCRLSFPHNYPDSSPQPYIVFDQENYVIPGRTNLINQKCIEITKNDALQTLINISYIQTGKMWKGNKNLSKFLAQLLKFLNFPSILQRKKNEIEYKNRNLLKSKGMGKNKNADRFIQSLQDQIIDLQLHENEVQAAEKQNKVSLAKLDFFNRNLPLLMNNMQKNQKQIKSQIASNNNMSSQMMTLEEINKFVLKDQVQREKIKIVAKKQTLKEAEKKLFEFLSTNLSQNSSSFSEHKTPIKSLYDNMFQVQMNYLLNTDKE